MIIREAQQRDVELLSEFLIKAWREAGPEAHGWTGATEEAMKHMSSHGFLSDLLGRDDTRVFIAIHGGRVVGFSSIKGMNDELVELSGIIVLESMTGAGVGSRLLYKSLDAARGDGYESMIVKTEAFNERALNFYQGKGFVPEATMVEDVEDTKVEIVKLVINL